MSSSPSFSDSAATAAVAYSPWRPRVRQRASNSWTTPAAELALPRRQRHRQPRSSRHRDAVRRRRASAWWPRWITATTPGGAADRARGRHTRIDLWRRSRAAPGPGDRLAAAIAKRSRPPTCRRSGSPSPGRAAQPREDVARNPERLGRLAAAANCRPGRGAKHLPGTCREHLAATYSGREQGARFHQIWDRARR